MSVGVRTAPVRPGPVPQPRFRLRRRAHKVALVAHVMSSVGWFGIAVGVAVAGLAAARTDDASLAHALYRAMEAAPWLSIPVGFLAIATGAVLSLGTSYGLIRHWWVVAKIAIAVAVVTTDAVIVARVAHDAALTGSAAGPLYGSTIAHVVVLAVATVLSVFKPRGRTAWGRRRAARAEP
jgi:vacuolar-type H+-ATPase subunit I/STV1